MTITTFLVLLAGLAAVSSIVTQGIKKFLDGQAVKYSANIIVLIVAIIVGCAGTAIFYVNAGIPFNALNSVYLALMGLANWLTAMLGYDKVKQAVEQLIVKK